MPNRGSRILCGALCEEARNKRRYGKRSHPLYDTWAGMLRRCGDPRHRAYRWYGARGISVCPRWMDFTAFAEDIEATLGPRPEGMTLDRIRNGLGYKPSNVRWATWEQQAATRRRAA